MYKSDASMLELLNVDDGGLLAIVGVGCPGPLAGIGTLSGPCPTLPLKNHAAT